MGSEKQIEMIQERLSSIETTLRDLSFSARSTLTSAAPGVSTPASSTLPSTPATTILGFEGDSGFGKHSAQASKVADSAALVENSSEIVSALGSLRSCLQSHSVSSRAHDMHLSKAPTMPEREEVELPPVGVVLEIVKKSKLIPPFIIVGLSWPDARVLEKLCQKVYFPMDPLPVGTVTLMYGFLYFVTREYYSNGTMTLGGWRLDELMEQCEREFGRGLGRYETMSVPTLENLQCLMLGVRLFSSPGTARANLAKRSSKHKRKQNSHSAGPTVLPRTQCV